MEWRDISTADPESLDCVLVWNGDEVCPANFYDWLGGWCSALLADHSIEPLNPQPTHWMPFPDPPKKDT